MTSETQKKTKDYYVKYEERPGEPGLNDMYPYCYLECGHGKNEMGWISGWRVEGLTDDEAETLRSNPRTHSMVEDDIPEDASANEATQDLVQFIDETAGIAAETCRTKGELEAYIRQSWDYDDSQRRAAVGSFEQFRKHVLNVLDVNYPAVAFE